MSAKKKRTLACSTADSARYAEDATYKIIMSAFAALHDVRNLSHVISKQSPKHFSNQMGKAHMNQ